MTCSRKWGSFSIHYKILRQISLLLSFWSWKGFLEPFLGRFSSSQNCWSKSDNSNSTDHSDHQGMIRDLVRYMVSDPSDIFISSCNWRPSTGRLIFNHVSAFWECLKPSKNLDYWQNSFLKVSVEVCSSLKQNLITQSSLKLLLLIFRTH